MSRKKISIIGALVLALCLVLCSFGSACDSDDPITITIWHYYDGDQLTAFDTLVSEFNNTVGAEQGINVQFAGQGGVNTLSDNIIESVQKKSGALPLPNIAAVYSETAFILDEYDALVDLDRYFTAEELAEYVPSYIEEGRFRAGGPLRLMPVSKSTEVTALNVTDWAAFENACGVSVSDITSIEDMVDAARTYYEWTDSLTPDVADDGKALYGRDSIENYVYSGAAQLGHELFTVDSDGKLTIDLDRDTFRALWDNYYVPMVNGWFYGEKDIVSDKSTYASDLARLEKVLALTCSTSAITYFPTEVVDESDVKRNVQATIIGPLAFENRERNAYVQQGAAYCVLKSTAEQEAASALFLKWFTEKEQNLEFSSLSSYCPAKTEANSKEAITAAFGAVDSEKAANMLNSLIVSSELLASGEAYACKPFKGAKDVRAYLGDALENITMTDSATVRAAIDVNKSRAQAISELNTDFDAWFDGVCAEVHRILD